MPRFPPHRPAQAGEGRVQRRGIHPRCVSLHSVADGIDHAHLRGVLPLVAMAVAEGLLGCIVLGFRHCACLFPLNFLGFPQEAPGQDLPAGLGTRGGGVLYHTTGRSASRAGAGGRSARVPPVGRLPSARGVRKAGAKRKIEESRPPEYAPSDFFTTSKYEQRESRSRVCRREREDVSSLGYSNVWRIS